MVGGFRIPCPPHRYGRGGLICMFLPGSLTATAGGREEVLVWPLVALTISYGKTQPPCSHDFVSISCTGRVLGIMCTDRSCVFISAKRLYFAERRKSTYCGFVLCTISSSCGAVLPVLKSLGFRTPASRVTDMVWVTYAPSAMAGHGPQTRRLIPGRCSGVALRRPASPRYIVGPGY